MKAVVLNLDGALIDRAPDAAANLFSCGYLRESVEMFEPMHVFDHFEALPDHVARSGAGR